LQHLEWNMIAKPIRRRFCCCRKRNQVTPHRFIQVREFEARN
jgi:hypothetical protein